MGCLVSGLKGKEMGLVKKKGNSSRSWEKGERGGIVENFTSPEL